MNNDLLKAKELLISQNYTCVLVKGDEVYHSFERGVKPLVEFIDKNISLCDFSAGDKVVGKATAFLYVLAEVKEVYAVVISKSAIDVFEKYGIKYQFDKKADYIINRNGDGYCPMETAVMNAENPQSALKAIKEKLKTL